MDEEKRRKLNVFLSGDEDFLEISLKGLVSHWESTEDSNKKSFIEKCMKDAVLNTTDLSELLSCWKDLPTNCEPKVFVETRLRTLIPTITEFGMLESYWRYFPETCMPQKLIEEQMVDNLQFMGDMEELIMCYCESVPDYTPRKLVEKRIVSLLAGTVNFKELINFRYNVRSENPELKALFEEKMIEVIPNIMDIEDLKICQRIFMGRESVEKKIKERMNIVALNNVSIATSIDELISYKKIPMLDSEPLQELLDKKIIELLPATLLVGVGFDQLGMYYSLINDIASRKLIEEKVSKILSNTVNFKWFRVCWNSIGSNVDLRKLIETRIIQVLATISKDNVPDDFVEVISDRKSDFVQDFIDLFKEKTKELVS